MANHASSSSDSNSANSSSSSAVILEKSVSRADTKSSGKGCRRSERLVPVRSAESYPEASIVSESHRDSLRLPPMVIVHRQPQYPCNALSRRSRRSGPVRSTPISRENLGGRSHPKPESLRPRSRIERYPAQHRLPVMGELL